MTDKNVARFIESAKRVGTDVAAMNDTGIAAPVLSLCVFNSLAMNRQPTGNI